ncbi:unnamed protein product [Mytilus coruscus]|uniref:Chromo domain-containing protein n=1 Tax=Mytilus coruscus TaxID=42192 RepID=A0A6J8AL33_MYTCO|nr:unnamed protein product [Mytilus coruscus]
MKTTAVSNFPKPYNVHDHLHFRLGQRVLVYNPKIRKGKSAKLHIKWTGPYYISDLGPNHTYGLHHCNTHKRLTSLIHANRLKPYEDPVDRDEFFPTTQDDFNQDDNVNRSQDDNVYMTQNHNSQTQLTQNDDEYGIVQDILAFSRHQGRKVYKIEWKNFAKTTWEPAHNVPQFLVREFHVKKNSILKNEEET